MEKNNDSLKWVDPRLIMEFIDNRKSLDSLAFAVLIKMTFRSSAVHNATHKRLKAIFGIGSDRLRRVLKRGVELNLLRWEGTTLIANSGIKGYNVENYAFTPSLFAINSKDSITDTSVDGGVKAPVKLNHIVKTFRKIGMLEGVKRNNYIGDLTNLEESEKIKNKRHLKRLMKLRQMLPYLFRHDRIAIATLAKWAGVSVSTARKLKKELILTGLLSEKENYELTDYDIDSLNNLLRKIDKEIGGKGYLTAIIVDGELLVARRLSNSYRAKLRDITKLKRKYKRCA